MALIEIDSLTKVYYRKDLPPVEALADVTIHVEHGEFVSLVGPSGCGKSTTLNIVGGLISKTGGVVRYKGHEVNGSRKEIGMMFQSPVLFDWRNVYENVMLPIDVLGMGRDKYRDRAMELLRTVGLEGFERSYPWELSGGMQQRVALCRLLLYNPDVLLLDEPYGSLDEFTREALNLELLKIWSGTGKTVMFVTHNIQEAVFLADRVVVMTPRPGRVVRVIEVELPRPREIGMMRSPKFVDLCFEVRQLLGVA